MAIELPTASTPLNNPSHSAFHRIVAADPAAPEQSITVDGAGAIGFAGAVTVTTSITGSYLTASEILITDGSKNIVSAPVATYPSLTELSYVKGATGPIQTQLNAKQATITFGTGVETALGVNIGSAGAPIVFDGDAGTPSALVGTNISGSATNLTSGITNALKSATTTVNVSSATAPTSGQVLTATSGTAATWQTPSGGGNTYFNNEYIDQSGGTSDTYGALSGTINGSNTTFTVSQSVYTTGTLTVYLNGQAQTQGSGEDWTETTPASGTFDFAVAPVSGDEILVTYQSQTLSSDTVVVTTGAQTLEDKAITKRVVTTTDDATAVIDVAVTDIYELTAIANATTFSFTGTPVDGQNIVIRFKDAGVTKGLTWTGFTAIGVTLPTATTAGKWTYVGVIYNAGASQYQVVAVTTEA